MQERLVAGQEVGGSSPSGNTREYADVMGRRNLVLVAAALVLIAVVVAVVSARRVRARPGDATFVLVDEAGRNLDTVAYFEVDGDDGSGFKSFLLTEGRHTLRVRPVTPHLPMSHEFTFEPFTVRLSVAGPEAPGTQEIPVKVSGALAWRLAVAVARTAAEPRSHAVEVELSWPDGGAAAGVPLRCLGHELVTNERGRAVCAPVSAVGVTIWARTPGLVATADLSGDEEEVALTLEPAMALRLVVLDGGARTPIAVNSKRLQQEVIAQFARPVVVTAPIDRTIVCAGHPPFGACDVVVPPPDGGARSIALAMGDEGRVRFEPRSRGSPVASLVVYLDRVKSDVSPGPTQTYAALPGQHVLVLNTGTGPERIELVFHVDAGAETELGVLELQ